MQEVVAIFEFLSSVIATFNGQAVLTVISLGMGLAFYAADPQSPTSKYLALFFLGVGASIALNTSFYHLYTQETVPHWTGISGVADMVAAVGGFEWILRIRRTIPSHDLRTTTGDNVLRVAQALMLFYAVMGFIYPTVKAHEFFGSFATPNEALFDKGFWLFALPMEASMTLGAFSVLLILNRRPEVQESIRLIAFVIAVPFLAAGLVLPTHMASISSSIGLMIFLIGAIQYHIHQGRRGLFMSRFLSPQVLEMVRQSGMDATLKDQNQEISVVACDLRGFTAFSEANSSQRVITVLREYYDAVGEIVASHGATIKDYAGDGILILVGAPLAYDDHAPKALHIAQHIVERVTILAQSWSQNGPQLGVGVGIASGPVTVGVIGGEGRMEYAAVGSAVNLASRLCENAKNREVLLDGRTRELLGSEVTQLDSREGLNLKGFGNNVPHWAL